jgi:carbon storage regulator CsrA
VAFFKDGHMALVLTRDIARNLYSAHPESQVWINDICITVLKGDGGGVKLAIDAPREQKILRGELKQEGESDE